METLAMEPEEWEVSEACALCGAAIGAEHDRCFAFGTGNLLCWECAAERGGRYDFERDAWDRPPELAGLADEAYGATPRERRGHHLRRTT